MHVHSILHTENVKLPGKKKMEDIKEEPEEVTGAREELAATRAKFPGLCLPDDVKSEVIGNLYLVVVLLPICVRCM